jgi:hypothetical protein
MGIATINNSLAQTNVSGGIYSNTTWLAANSPYLVTDTVVVFPGVTLTIEPGVIVKFVQGKQLVVRQSTLIANGTVSDSISFTSDSSHYPGSWSGLYFDRSIRQEFNFCNFEYATIGIYKHNTGWGDTTILRNSLFRYNLDGYVGYYAIMDSCRFISNKMAVGWHIQGRENNCEFIQNEQALYGDKISITDCHFFNNQTSIKITGNSNITNCNIDSSSIVGIYLNWDWTEIKYCSIQHCGIGIYDYASPTYGKNIITNNIIEQNDTGIKTNHWQDTIKCNYICNNHIYNFYYNTNSNPCSIKNNFWCTNDSSTIASTIYDGYDNINLGLANFMPFDSQSCYLNTGIVYLPDFQQSIFPNPSFEHIYFKFPIELISIIDLNGFEYKSFLNSTKEYGLDISDLMAGLYVLKYRYEKQFYFIRFMKY